MATSDAELWAAVQRVCSHLRAGHVQLALVIEGDTQQLAMPLNDEEVYRLLRHGFSGQDAIGEAVRKVFLRTSTH